MLTLGHNRDAVSSKRAYTAQIQMSLIYVSFLVAVLPVNRFANAVDFWNILSYKGTILVTKFSSDNFIACVDEEFLQPVHLLD